MSANHTICRASAWHSLRVVSSTIITKSRVAAVLVVGEFRQSASAASERPCARRLSGGISSGRLPDSAGFRRRLLRAVEQLLAVDDLQDAALVGAVAEVDAVALRAGRDHAVQFGRHRAGRAGLLAGQAEVADVHRLGRIAEIVDLRHAAGAPVRHAGNEIGNAGVAFPPALVRVAAGR